MIVSKSRRHPKEAGVVHCQPFADTKTTTVGIRVSQDDIRMCAYYIYEKRGNAHGSETQDWAQAERLIVQR